MEQIKWVRICLTCEGSGSVVDEDFECLWVCPTCNGTGEEGGEWGSTTGTTIRSYPSVK